MTTIALRSGIVAADSRATHDESIDRADKLFAKKVGRKEVVLAIAGDVYAANVFVDWFGSGKEPPAYLSQLGLDEDFEVLILMGGAAFTSNHLCRLVKVLTPFTALGSGRHAALAAMHCGKGAREAVAVACKVDPYTAPPIVTMRMPGYKG